MGTAKPYAANPDGSLMTQPDYMMAHRDTILQKWDEWAEKQMPGDLQCRNRVARARTTGRIEATYHSQEATYRADNSYVIRAVDGDMSNGKPPASYMELSAIPGVKAVLNRVEAQDPRFSQGIDGMIGG